MSLQNIFKKTKSNIFSFKFLIVFILFLLALGTTIYFYNQNKKAQNLLNNPGLATETETNDLIEKIGALMVLPEGEKPTLVSVTDKDKVKDQPFFSKAENGDKVLVYTAAKKAILYRPSSDKIIEVGPVDIAPETKFKVALYNSTSDTNLLATTEKTLLDQVTNLEFPVKEKITYSTTKSIVVDIVGDKKAEADQLAKLINGEVSALPSGVTKTNTDFLIIIGK